ncbi:Gfo/Idh/MocA family protein [Butyrivibrio sp. MC2013]|uniref:Gfo/Idh/MocA family protein n=1 Tax=Butyrivibrio sp. MC2013 TaxID=1280686 RepID=UPI0003FC3D6D|nr:Gfo/Idh/MocA family oxidoreductase [Butyrivibrio sp. MC2013]
MRSAIVGCGSIASVHGQALARLDAHQLVAVADIDMARAVKIADEYGARAYDDLEEMLDREEIDVLHICTPHYLHVPMAELALARGIHVFMEKPPVISMEQWTRLKEAYDKRADNARLGFCFQNRYNENVLYAKKMLQSGIYGQLLGTRAFVTWRREDGYYEDSLWRGQLSTEGGGVLINQAIHTLDLIQFLSDEEPISIRAVTDRQHLSEDIEVEDTVAAYISYPHSRACFFATTSYVKDMPPIIELECEKIRIRLEDTLLTIYRPDGSSISSNFMVGDRLGKSYWGAGHLAAIGDFYRCIEEDRPYPIEIYDIENTVRLLLEAYKAAGRRESYGFFTGQDVCADQRGSSVRV